MDERNIPIDIHVGKLLEWLLSRHIAPKNWHTRIPNIRNRIGLAINDMPSHEELVKLLLGTHIHYFHCLRIIEILKTTEADTKSMFGRYSSQRMKDWLEIVRLYEKDNVYIAEAAQTLVRNIQYDLPSVKRQSNKFELLIAEAEKKMQDQTASEAALHAQRAAMCQKLCITGEHLKQEFTDKLGELPDIYTDIVVSTKKLIKSLGLFAKASEIAECLPLLRHVIAKGNTTVYEYVHGEPPLSIEEPLTEIKLTICNSDSNSLPIDDDNEIDFGDEEKDYGNEIDFGDTDNAAEIDWGNNQIIQGHDNKSPDDSRITIESSGLAGGVARKENAFTVLDSPSYRELFLDELFELESFLRLRAYELNTLENSSTFLIIENMDDHTAANFADSLKDVENTIKKATNEMLQQLHQLKHSEKYADILAGKLQQKIIAIKKIKVTRKSLREKVEQFKQDKASIEPLIGKLTDQTKHLQEKVAEDISKRYKNRLVNLMGGLSLF